MKQKFVKGSKILVGLFVFLLIIFLCYVFAENPEEVEWLGFVAIPFFIVLVLTIISFVIMFVSELIEIIKERKWKVFLEILLGTLLFSIMRYLYNTFVEHISYNLVGYLLPSFLLTCFVISLNYWKRYS